MATEPTPPPVSSSSVATPAASTEPPLGFIGTLAGLYTSPAETFRAVAARPSFVVALLCAVALNAAFTFVWLRKMDPVEFTKAQMEEKGVFDRVPAERHAEIVERQARLMPIFAWLGPALFVPLGFVVMSALFLFVFRFFYASGTTFRQSMAVICWTLFAVGLVTTPLTLLVLSLRGEWSVDPRTAIQANPAALFEKGAVPKAVEALLESLDLFSAWILFLLSAGYAATSRRSVGSAAVGVISLWAIYVLLKVGWAAIF